MKPSHLLHATNVLSPWPRRRALRSLPLADGFLPRATAQAASFALARTAAVAPSAQAARAQPHPRDDIPPPASATSWTAGYEAFTDDPTRLPVSISSSHVALQGWIQARRDASTLDRHETDPTLPTTGRKGI